MEEILRKLSIAFTAGALGAGAGLALLAAVDASGLLVGFHPPLNWFLDTDYVFKQAALGILFGLALNLPLLSRFAMLRGLVFAFGLAALLLLVPEVGAPEKITALGDTAWQEMRRQTLPIVAAYALVWGCVAALFYKAATKQPEHEAIHWEEEDDDVRDETVSAEQLKEALQREAVRRQQEPVVLQHAAVSEPEPAQVVDPVLIPRWDK